MDLNDPAARRRRIILLGILTALGSLAIQMFVPAMPDAAIDLGAPASELQLALTLYLIGVAFGQVATGPVSDRLGRRPVLIGGALLFVAGSCLCWAADTVGMLLLGRIVQALGASSGLVAGRAMAGDGGSARGAGDMALLTAIVMLSPMLGPVLGSALTHAAGWRAVFAALSVGGVISAAAMLRWLPETFAGSGPGSSTLLSDWRRILGNRIFLRHLALGTASNSALYTFLAASPFLFIETYRAEPQQLGLFYGIIALGAGGGALTASRLAARWPAPRIIRAGTRIALTGATALLLGVLAGWHSVAALVVPMMTLAFGGGLVTPNATMAALASTPGRAGTAVSLYGALSMAGSAAVTLAVAALPSHNPLAPAIGIVMLASVGLVLGQRRDAP